MRWGTVGNKLKAAIGKSDKSLNQISISNPTGPEIKTFDKCQTKVSIMTFVLPSLVCDKPKVGRQKSEKSLNPNFDFEPDRPREPDFSKSLTKVGILTLPEHRQNDAEHPKPQPGNDQTPPSETQTTTKHPRTDNRNDVLHFCRLW